MLNCLTEYLTPECHKCPDWHDGSDGSYGCGTHFPIDWCPAFKVMEAEYDNNSEEKSE